MGRAYFPVNRKSDVGMWLIEAANLIDKAAAEYSEAVWCGDDGQYDNSASDGGAIARLRVAEGLCRDEVMPEQKKEG